MTLKETVSVFAILTAAYPYFYQNIRNDDEQTKTAVALWHQMLAEYDITTVTVALKRLIAIHKEYPPTIGQLLESIIVVSGHSAPDEDEVWSEITDAISKYGFYGTKEALAQFSPVALAVVKSLGWSTLCMSETPEANRAHFLRIYPAIKARHEQKHILPEDVRLFISAHASDRKEIAQSTPPTNTERIETCDKMPMPNENSGHSMVSLKDILKSVNQRTNKTN
jgi:hypothetical protein